MAAADPMVIADDLHIVYRVFGAGGDKGTAATALLRLEGEPETSSATTSRTTNTASASSARSCETWRAVALMRPKITLS